VLVKRLEMHRLRERSEVTGLEQLVRPCLAGTEQAGVVQEGGVAQVQVSLLALQLCAMRLLLLVVLLLVVVVVVVVMVIVLLLLLLVLVLVLVLVLLLARLGLVLHPLPPEHGKLRDEL
jgi:hypothetical protein